MKINEKTKGRFPEMVETIINEVICIYSSGSKNISVKEIAGIIFDKIEKINSLRTTKEILPSPSLATIYRRVKLTENNLNDYNYPEEVEMNVFDSFNFTRKLEDDYVMRTADSSKNIDDSSCNKYATKNNSQGGEINEFSLGPNAQGIKYHTVASFVPLCEPILENSFKDEERGMEQKEKKSFPIQVKFSPYKRIEKVSEKVSLQHEEFGLTNSSTEVKMKDFEENVYRDQRFGSLIISLYRWSQNPTVENKIYLNSLPAP